MSLTPYPYISHSSTSTNWVFPLKSLSRLLFFLLHSARCGRYGLQKECNDKHRRGVSIYCSSCHKTDPKWSQSFQVLCQSVFIQGNDYFYYMCVSVKFFWYSISASTILVFICQYYICLYRTFINMKASIGWRTEQATMVKLSYRVLFNKFSLLNRFVCHYV